MVPVAIPIYAAQSIRSSNGGRRDAATGAKLKEEGVLAGVADLILLKSNRQYGALLIETKTKKKVLKAIIKRNGNPKIVKDGYKYVVCRSLEEFIEVVNDYLAEK